MGVLEDLTESFRRAAEAAGIMQAAFARRPPVPTRTSDIFRGSERCQISDLPDPWCACWVCRPDIPFGADEATDDNTEENL